MSTSMFSIEVSEGAKRMIEWAEMHCENVQVALQRRIIEFGSMTGVSNREIGGYKINGGELKFYQPMLGLKSQAPRINFTYKKSNLSITTDSMSFKNLPESIKINHLEFIDNHIPARDIVDAAFLEDIEAIHMDNVLINDNQTNTIYTLSQKWTRTADTWMLQI